MPRKSTPTMADAVAEYQETRAPKVSPATHRNDGSLLTTFCRAMGEAKQVHLVTQRQVELWFAAEARRQKASSYNKVRTRVKGFLDFCTRRGWVSVDLLVEVGTLRVVKQERLRLSVVELLDLPRHAGNPRDRAFITVACNTALRANELCSLRIRDVDLHSGWLDAHITKSALEDRMPISLELDEALRGWLSYYQKEVGPLQPDWYLFPQRRVSWGRTTVPERQASLSSDGLFTTVVMQETLLPEQRLCNPAEVVTRALSSQGHPTIGQREGCHTIRRSVARAYFDSRVAAGYDGALRETAALLHHAHSHTTEDYLGLTTERLGRDRALRGQPFLTAMVSGENVVGLATASQPSA